jgi:hypothetical protein
MTASVIQPTSAIGTDYVASKSMSASQHFTPNYEDFSQHSDLYLNGQPLRFPQRLLVNPNIAAAQQQPQQISSQSQQTSGTVRRVRPIAVPPPPGFDGHSSSATINSTANRTTPTEGALYGGITQVLLFIYFYSNNYVFEYIP